MDGRSGLQVSCILSCSTTHWKQTLFMMDDPVPVHRGDVVTGFVVLQRNPVWRRHMSVTLSWTVTSKQDPTSQKVSKIVRNNELRVLSSQKQLSGDNYGKGFVYTWKVACHFVPF